MKYKIIYEGGIQTEWGPFGGDEFNSFEDAANFLKEYFRDDGKYEHVDNYSIMLLEDWEKNAG